MTCKEPQGTFFPSDAKIPGELYSVCPGHTTAAVVLSDPCQAGPGVSKGITIPGLRKHAKLFVDEVFFYPTNLSRGGRTQSAVAS